MSEVLSYLNVYKMIKAHLKHLSSPYYSGGHSQLAPSHASFQYFFRILSRVIIAIILEVCFANKYFIIFKCLGT